MHVLIPSLPLVPCWSYLSSLPSQTSWSSLSFSVGCMSITAPAHLTPLGPGTDPTTSAQTVLHNKLQTSLHPRRDKDLRTDRESPSHGACCLLQLAHFYSTIYCPKEQCIELHAGPSACLTANRNEKTDPTLSGISLGHSCLCPHLVLVHTCMHTHALSHTYTHTLFLRVHLTLNEKGKTFKLLENNIGKYDYAF